MSTAVPSAVKAADVLRFALRAGQLEKARPAVAYWCNYWIVEQIISKGLHQADDESKSYTMQLMDKLEQTKADYADNDAIVDEVAGHAYVEQFALETFQRADNAMRANKVTKQTADTFQAARTFLELCEIWGPLDQEISSKIKFAKYHALRIAKAFKAGEDPNRSNPTPETQEADVSPSFQEANADSNNSNGDFATPYHQPSVEDAPDLGSHTGAPPPTVEHYYQQPPAPEVSPLGPSSPEMQPSETEGYFPTMPGAPSDIPSPPSSLPPPAASSQPPDYPPSNPHESAAAYSREPPTPDFGDATGPQAPPFAPPSVPSQQRSSMPTPQVPQSSVLPQPIASNLPSRQSVTNLPPQTGFRDDETSVMTAQKHAKFAISALNFEDVPTAVKYLRDALECLGAR